MFLQNTLRRIENYENERRAMIRHAGERCPSMRHRPGQPGIDYPILPPNPHPRLVPDGRPRTCYHGYLPGICRDPVCRSDPRETGPYRGRDSWVMAHQPPPKVIIVDSRGHGHPYQGRMRHPHPHHHHHHGGLHHHPHHGGYDPFDDDYEDDDDEDGLSIYSDSLISTMDGYPTHNHHVGHGGHGHHHAGHHFPLSHGFHHGHPHPMSDGSIFGTEESY